jgi:hypothetical protein
MTILFFLLRLRRPLQLTPGVVAHSIPRDSKYPLAAGLSVSIYYRFSQFSARSREKHLLKRTRHMAPAVLARADEVIE